MSNNHNQMPYSDRYREAAMDWCDKDAAARMLEECKSSFIATRKQELGDIADNKADKLVRSSEEYKDYIKKMVNAKTAANRAKIQLNYIEAKSWEQRSSEANRRAEMRLT